MAIQQGHYAAEVVEQRLTGGPTRRRSTTATRGISPRSAAPKAVADIKGIRVAGFPAWVLWLTVHLFYLIGFQNRLLVVLRWTASFVSHGRGARLIGERL